MMLLFLVLSVAVFAQEAEPKLDVFDLIRNMDWLNVALVAVLSVGGAITRYAVIGRTKLKQAGELLILLYDYTDDKVLDDKERADIWDHILVFIGKKKADTIQQAVVDAGGTKQVIRSKTKIKIKTRSK